MPTVRAVCAPNARAGEQHKNLSNKTQKTKGEKARRAPREALCPRALGYAYGALGRRDQAAAAFHQAMRQYVLVGDMVGGSEAESLEKRAKTGQPLGGWGGAMP